MPPLVCCEAGRDERDRPHGRDTIAFNQDMGRLGYFSHDSAGGTQFWQRNPTLLPGTRIVLGAGENFVSVAPSLNAGRDEHVDLGPTASGTAFSPVGAGRRRPSERRCRRVDGTGIHAEAETRLIEDKRDQLELNSTEWCT